MPGQYNQVPARDKIKIGEVVQVLQKKDYESGKITKGKVVRILTSLLTHPRGIKVMLDSGEVGRVQALNNDPIITLPEKGLDPIRNYQLDELPGEDDLR